MRFLALLPLLFASPALAGPFCDDLWFTRNLVMHNAGYCFGSTLGQTYFGTGPCIGKNVSPDRAGHRLIAEIQGMEREFGCRGQVNTRGRYLDVPDIGIRMQLYHFPLPAEYPGACAGWRGPTTVLHAGRQASTYTFGLIEPGDWVSYEHEPVDGWVYVTASEHNGDGGPLILKSGGWVPENQIRSGPCDQYLP